MVKDYTDKIAGSINILRTEYTTAGSKRLKALSELTGGDPDLPAFTKRWFDDVWPEDVTKAKYVESMIACQRKTGLVDGAIDNSKYHNPAEPDEVDEHCEVGKKLKAYIVSNEGKPKPAARGGK